VHAAGRHGGSISNGQLALLVHHVRLLARLQLEWTLGRRRGAGGSRPRLRCGWATLTRVHLIVLVQQALRRLIALHDQLLAVQVERGSLRARS
jgi:hypothetical protein